jgi:hypothetical protein
VSKNWGRSRNNLFCLPKSLALRGKTFSHGSSDKVTAAVAGRGLLLTSEDHVKAIKFDDPELNLVGDIQGLTTAAGVWMTAAIGVAVGLGSQGVAALSTLFTLIILTLAGRLDLRAEKKRAANIKGKDGARGYE